MNRSLWIAAIGLSIGILPYELLSQIDRPNINLLLFAVSGESFAAGLEASVFVAFMMSLCNSRFSATQFALFSSFMLAGRSLIIGPMGGIYQGLGGSNFFWISILAAVPSLLLLLYVAPLNIKKLLVSGSKAKENNDLNTAIDRFSHAIDLDPRNDLALTERSLLRAELGKKISDRGASYPEDVSTKKIDCYQDAIGYYQGAIEDCNRAIDIKATTYHLREELIKIQQGALENLNRAIDISDRAIEISPKHKPNPNLYNDRAAINLNLGDLQSAIADSDRAIELDNTSAEFHLIRGKIRERLDNRPDAISDL
jgi:tetratricopeptide (TPR) repeat protein